MKKYIPIDFDEKGKPILGNAKDTPTSNGFIPTTWVPGGGSEDEGNGMKSITITPAIETTPALEDFLPCYYHGHTGTLTITANWGVNASYTITATPTPDWYVFTDDDNGEIGQPLEFTLTTDGGETITAGTNFGVSSQDDADYIQFMFASKKQ